MVGEEGMVATLSIVSNHHICKQKLLISDATRNYAASILECAHGCMYEHV